MTSGDGAGVPGSRVGEPGTQRAFDLYRCITGDVPVERLCVGVIPGPPWAKKRPRFTKFGHAYHDPADKAAEKDTAIFLRALTGGVKFTGNVGVVAIFYRPDKRRIDEDNMKKHLLDAGTFAGIWDDDSQVTANVGIIEFDKTNPRTVVLIGDHNSTLKRGSAAA